jgi:hypothetical protein
MRRAKLLLFVVPIFFCDRALAATIKTENFNISYSGITDNQAKTFAEIAEQALQDVTSYLGKRYRKTIWIRIGDNYDFRRADTKKSMITIPANRIRGDAPGPPRIRGRGPGIVHEVTHIVAPSRGRSGRFLDEGLGIYMQEKFGGPDDRTYPNMGRDLHEETARLVQEYGKIIPLKNAEAVRADITKSFARGVAYIEEGSFVRHLIETYGLEKFMKVYEGDRYENVYGKEFGFLAEEWRERIAKLLTPTTNE